MQWGTVQSLQYSRDGDCGNVCPKTSLVLSTLKHAQTPKSPLSLGPSWCLRGTVWRHQVLQLLLHQQPVPRALYEAKAGAFLYHRLLHSGTSSRARSLGAAGRAHGFPIRPVSRIRAAEMPGRAWLGQAPAIWGMGSRARCMGSESPGPFRHLH